MNGLPRRQSFRRPGVVLLRLLQDRHIGQRRERRHQDRALGRLQDTRIAIINGPIQQGSRPGPRATPIFGVHIVHPAERAYVGFAPSGPGQQQLTRFAPGDRRPAMVILRLRADDPYLEHPGGGCGARGGNSVWRIGRGAGLAVGEHHPGRPDRARLKKSPSRHSGRTASVHQCTSRQ